METSANQLVEAVQHIMFGTSSGRYDVKHLADIIAAIESADYYTQYMLATPSYDDRLRLVADAVHHAPNDGLYLEFGVASGHTINHISSQKPEKKIYGFDSFLGLPEDWREGYLRGRFAQTSLPKVSDQCELIVGLFNDTLPKFIDEKREPIAFIHIDCDLYSSTKTVLACCAPYIGPGTVIVFDEYFNYSGWKQHEYLAWQEFCRDYNIKAKHLGFVSSGMQVAFVVE